MACLDDGLAQQVAGLGVLHGVDRCGGVLDAQPEGLRDLGADRLAGGVEGECLAAAQESGLGDDPEHQVGVGVGRLGATRAVAGGARHGLGAPRADLEVAAGVDPGDRAATGADGVHLEGGHVDRVVVDDRAAGTHRLPLDDEADQERGAADVGGDDVAVPELAAEGLGADDPAGEDRADGADRVRGRLGRGDRTAVGLHHQERTGQAALGQLALEGAEVVTQPGGDLRAHHGGGAPGELSDPRADLARERDEEVGGDLVDDLADPLLVSRVAEGPEERDRDRLHALVDEGVHGPAYGLLVERDDHVAVPVDPLHDLESEPLGDQAVGLALRHHVLQLVGGGAEVATLDVHDVDRVAVSDGGQEPDRAARGPSRARSATRSCRARCGGSWTASPRPTHRAARPAPRGRRPPPRSSPAASTAPWPRRCGPRRRRAPHL